MRRILFSILIILSVSCSLPRPMQKHGDCLVTYLNKKNNRNNTEIINILKTISFDTTATLIHGYVLDYETSKPIVNAAVSLFSYTIAYTTSTNNDGEFEIFEDLTKGHGWNININDSNHICLFIVNAVQANGEWLEIKLHSKLLPTKH